MGTADDSPPPESPAAAPEEPAAPPNVHRSPPPALLRRRIPWLIGALLVAAVGAFAYHLAFGRTKVVYSTAAVERGDVESTVVAAGILQPSSYVDVGAQTSGKLKSLKVQRGDQVAKDQLLAEIDPVLADTALTAAKATLESMTSQRSVKQTQLVLATAQRDRNEKLSQQLLISDADRDITRANYEVARADVASLSAQMKQATAAVDTATANRGYTKITAPMAGEVVSISALEGQTLNANQQAPTILRIADISTVTVWAQVSEADIVRVKPGQDVHFTVLGSARRWSGTVRQILPTPELINAVVFYDVLFDIPNPERELKIQMTAQVFIVLAQAKGVLLIPTAAVGNAGEGARLKVQVLKANGSVEQRAIKIGIKSEIMTEVTEGLKEKEQVVLGGMATPGATRNPLAVRRGP
ncbi:MAG: efflux RND transporter periplasmic adaptor subunit [Acidobacteria bacterium]|nr:MAG: efflux RND transporter periplasmic adaptor subunit [Acidobacteriota bacterium]